MFLGKLLFRFAIVHYSVCLNVDHGVRYMTLTNLKQGDWSSISTYSLFQVAYVVSSKYNVYIFWRVCFRQVIGFSWIHARQTMRTSLNVQLQVGGKTETTHGWSVDTIEYAKDAPTHDLTFPMMKAWHKIDHIEKQTTDTRKLIKETKLQWICRQSTSLPSLWRIILQGR